MRRQHLLFAIFLFFFSAVRGQPFTIRDVLISSPDARIFDVEVDPLKKRICWQSPDDDRLWVCRLDTVSWTLAVPDGRETLIDSTLVPYDVTSNSGEWGYDLFGTYLVYSKTVARKRYIALAYETPAGWMLSTLLDAPHRMNPHASQNPLDSFASIHYLPTNFGNYTKYKSRRNLNQEHWIHGFTDAHWAADEQILTGILPNGQVGLFDLSNPVDPVQITFETGKVMSKPYLWKDPHLGMARLLFAVADGEVVNVYRESIPGTRVFKPYMSFPSPSQNPLYIKIGSPEPTVYMGQSYISLMASSSECETSCYPGEIWLVRIDSAAPMSRMVSDPSVGVRSDPETLATSDSLYVIYSEVIGANTPEAIWRLRRCDTGIGIGQTTGTTRKDPVPEEAVVCPNPFTNRICLKKVTGKEYFRLSDLSGKILWTGRHIETHDFSALPKGPFILDIREGTASRQVRLIHR